MAAPTTKRGDKSQKEISESGQVPGKKINKREGGEGGMDTRCKPERGEGRREGRERKVQGEPTQNTLRP